MRLGGGGQGGEQEGGVELRTDAEGEVDGCEEELYAADAAEGVLRSERGVAELAEGGAGDEQPCYGQGDEVADKACGGAHEVEEQVRAHGADGEDVKSAPPSQDCQGGTGGHGARAEPGAVLEA